MLGHDGPLEALKRPLRRPKRPSSCFQEAFKEIFKIAKIRQEAPGGPKRPPGSIFGCFLIDFDGFLMDFSWFVKGFFLCILDGFLIYFFNYAGFIFPNLDRANL